MMVSQDLLRRGFLLHILPHISGTCNFSGLHQLVFAIHPLSMQQEKTPVKRIFCNSVQSKWVYGTSELLALVSALK